MTSRTRSSTPGSLSALYLALGAVWAFRSLQSFSDPDFTHPDSVNDWLAVVSPSVGAVLLAGALLSLPASGAGRWLLRLVAVAALVVGVSNFAEDGLGVGAAGTAYFIGTTALVAGLAISTVVLLLRPPRWPAVVTALSLVGLVKLENGGGLLLLAGWVYAAWAARRTPPPG
jgi:hypothetical protein